MAMQITFVSSIIDSNIVFLALVHCNNAAKILGVFPMTTHSHYTLGRTLLEGLADKGHQVTIITGFKEDHPKFEVVELSGMVEAMHGLRPKLDSYDKTRRTPLYNTMAVHRLGEHLVRNTFTHPTSKEFLASNRSYDVVILEQFVNEAFRGICHHFKVPCVILLSVETSYWVNIPTGNPQHPSYVPHLTSEQFDHLDFTKRLKNALLSTFVEVYYHFHVVPRQDQLMHQVFPSAPPLQQLLYKPTITLLNSHVTPVPRLPSMIEVGGFHVKPPKRLAPDLQEYLDEAKEGVVYFSMGSVLQSKDTTSHKMSCFLAAFARLKEKVLWKFEGAGMENKSANVHISQWLPQQDILAHPNVKLFVSHGGMLSTTEALHRGVPILGIPIYGDQPLNIRKAVHHGYALELEYTTLTEDSIFAALREMLDNPRYSENAKRLSRLSKDRPLSPLDEAVYWVEYAIRNQDLGHLRCPSLDLRWYQYLLLDVLAFIAVAVLLLLWITKLCLCAMWKLCASRGKRKME